MATCLKVDASASDSYLSNTLTTDEGFYWVTFELYMTKATRASILDGTFSPYLYKGLASDESDIGFLYLFTSLFSADYGTSVNLGVASGRWQKFEFFVNNIAGAQSLYVDGNLAFNAAAATSGILNHFILGFSGGGSNTADSIFYYRNFKIGTSRNSSDIFDGSALANWTSVTGTVTEVDQSTLVSNVLKMDFTSGDAQVVKDLTTAYSNLWIGMRAWFPRSLFVDQAGQSIHVLDLYDTSEGIPQEDLLIHIDALRWKLNLAGLEAGVPTPNSWQWIELNYVTSGTLDLYVNGALVGSVTSTTGLDVQYVFMVLSGGPPASRSFAYYDELTIGSAQGIGDYWYDDFSGDLSGYASTEAASIIVLADEDTPVVGFPADEDASGIRTATITRLR